MCLTVCPLGVFPQSGAQDASSNQREASVTRMVHLVAAVYIVCTIPNIVNVLARSFLPEFFGGRRYNNLFFVTLAVVFIMEAFNCSVNFLIYYTMSTRYRQTLHAMLGRARGGGNTRGADSTSRGGEKSGANVKYISTSTLDQQPQHQNNARPLKSFDSPI